MTIKTVHMAVYDTLADWEVGAATAHIANNGWHREPGTFQVVTVGLSTDPITTAGRLRVTPDLALADLDPADSAMLILPGADLWEGDALAPFEEAARRFVAAGVPVAGICGATFGLARAGLLDDRAHTSNASEYLAYSGYSGGAHYVDAPAVTDRDVITADSMSPFEFAREVFTRLEVSEPRIIEAWYQLFAHRDPAAYAVLAEYEAAHA
ncbi:glutamine amidotransferase [Nocardia neocaledoniensis NBRC 108232]|uniref:DJ-1/PfpI family protein n=1 Tax=Nocardia neocaledoniensis TaxID=236511 RepID=A0A317NI78_9NOCA|nr:DJ-1/PfpI family protein [Nocardia neocaledoniensis]PWV73388.1 DJ-1/PfpI family protein [Nocardia neocaledoniensis]GEM33551.1 glutamine amidotransferase [Nocardia neocaledoniensis NBRC 108232]